MVEQFGPAVQGPFALGDPSDLRARMEGAGLSTITVEVVTLRVRFPRQPYVRSTILGSMAAIPSLAQVDPITREQMIATVEQQAMPALVPYVEGEDLIGPMTANVATAYAP